jgi:6-hydroxytryprostatin B O-methyltransferase
MDFPANAESGRKMVAESQPPSISSRITFQGHDFYEPQPITGADVYLLRMILHDWPDAEAVKILKNLVVAMDAKSRIIIMDTVLPKPGSVPVSVERIARARDMTMLQAFNSKERDLDDWKELLMATDEGLDLVSVTQPPGSALSVLEIKLRPRK